MKIKIPDTYSEEQFFSILLKAIDKVEKEEAFSAFKWIKEYQQNYLDYLKTLIDQLIVGLSIKLKVNPNEIKKSCKFNEQILLKTSEGLFFEETLLLKSFWTDLRDKYTKVIKKFKKFGFKKDSIEPIVIDSKVTYNPETKELMTNKDWNDFNKKVTDYFKEYINPENELIAKAGLFGLLKMKMDNEGIDLKEQQNMSWDDVVKKFGNEINDEQYIKKEIDKNESVKKAIEFAKDHSAEYLSINDGAVKTKIVNLVRKQLTSGIEDGLDSTQMISRLYHVNLEDELGQDLNQKTINAYNRDLRRIVLTEFNSAFTNGYLAAGLDESLRSGEKKYFVYTGRTNPDEKPNEPCNKWLGKICLLVDKPQSSDETNDKYADYLIWVGKNAIGRDWIAIPSHPNCTHSFQEINPVYQQYNKDINNIEWKVEKSGAEEFDLIKNDKIKKVIDWQGYKLGIEWNKGETRQYPGSPYKNLMQYDYGYIKNTNSPDGEEIDVCVNVPIKQNKTIYMLFQVLDGEYDELKFGIGFGNANEFRSKYQKTMTKYMFGGIVPLSLKKFKSEIDFFWKRKGMIKSLKNNENIFVDMDGVLCDFDKQFIKYFGKNIDKVLEEKNWKFVENKINSIGIKFWLEMQWTKNGKNLIKSLKNKNWRILSSYNGFKYAVEGKKQWLYENLNYKIDTALIVKGNKENYCNGKNDILIDDMDKNINSWIKKGGIGILYKDGDKIPEINNKLQKSDSFFNINMNKEKLEGITKQLKEVTDKIKKEFNWDEKIIVHFYKKGEDKEDVAENSEGVINIFENSTDIIGDYLHELGHLFYRSNELDRNKDCQILLRVIKQELNRGKGLYNRVFNNAYTYSNTSELFATLFLWFTRGDFIDDIYKEVLEEYCPEYKDVVEMFESYKKTKMFNEYK